MRTETLKRLAGIVRKNVNQEDCFLNGHGDCCVAFDRGIFNLTRDEILEFSTTSCNVQLWSFRALAARLGIAINRADWVWHNA